MKVAGIYAGTINKNNTSFRAEIMKRQSIYTKYFLDKEDNDSLCIRGEANKFFTGEMDFDARTLISNKKCGKNAIVTPMLEKYKNLRILLSDESKIVANGKSPDKFSVSIKKEKEEEEEKKRNNGPHPAFGTLYGSIRCNKNETSDRRMENEYKRFFYSGIKKLAETKYRQPLSNEITDEYNHFTPTDGDGTRFKPVSVLQGGITKPASLLPATFNGRSLSFIQAVLTNFARTGTMDDNLQFIKVEPAKGSAYAFLEGLKDGIIPTDKPIVFSWGDNFTDVNISRLINKHEKFDSGFTMLVLPKSREKVSALGVIGVRDESDVKLDNRRVDSFVEKPTNKAQIENLVVDELSDQNGDKVLAVVGPYVISREALEWLKNEYTENPERFHNDKGYDFSSTIITGLIDAMRNCEIVNRNTGKPMSMYFDIKKDSESWSDVGSRADYAAAAKAVTKGKFSNLPDEIKTSMKQNYDENGNIYVTARARKLANEMAKELNITLSNCIVTLAE